VCRPLRQCSGTQALNINTSGNRNTANGDQALFQNNTGSDNTGSGFRALRNNTTGVGNTAFGANALRGNTPGSFNTAIGFTANVSANNLTNAMAIGANALVDASNKIRLGDGNVTLVEMPGTLRVGADSTVGCVVDGDGDILTGTCVSDARLKTDVVPFSALLQQVVKLQPVHYRWNEEQFPDLQLGSAHTFGLIAQDVESILPVMVAEDPRAGAG
jgi:hypothetical protein